MGEARPLNLLKSNKAQDKSKAYLFGQFSTRDNQKEGIPLLKFKPQDIDFGYQKNQDRKSPQQMSQKSERIILEKSDKRSSPNMFNKKRLSEDEIGSMTVRELSKLDPKRALEELLIKYKRVKDENGEIQSIIRIKNITIHEMEAQLKNSNQQIILNEKGVPYTKDMISKLKNDSKLNQHYIEKYENLENFVRRLEEENRELINSSLQNEEFKTKLIKLEYVQEENQCLTMEVTKLRAKTMLLKRQLQKLSSPNSVSPAGNAVQKYALSNSLKQIINQKPQKNESSLQMITNHNFGNTFYSQQPNTLEELDFVSSKLESLLELVLSTSVSVKDTSSKSFSKEKLINGLKELKLKTQMLSKKIMSGTDQSKSVIDSEIGLETSPEIEELTKEITRLKLENQSIVIYENKLNQKNLELKKLKSENKKYAQSLESQNKEMLYMQRSLKQANSLLGVKIGDGETKVSGDLGF